NLLQSLYALTSMAQQLPGEGTGGLMQRQLPQLAQRLRTTLDKLRAPEVANRELTTSARAWWSELGKRVSDPAIELDATIESDMEVPAAVFDSFVENGIDNARQKSREDPDIEIKVKLTCTPQRIELAVSDSGSPVDPEIVRRLFREPIERGGSLGIGLYQAARMAAQAGYRVELADNRPGRVCLALVREGTALGEG
ncbi:MAG TPA: ATP-binding protein, partial [Usitatibacter sp.]|nr:ATP-binding protein [Usitatibacter sp.]